MWNAGASLGRRLVSSSAPWANVTVSSRQWGICIRSASSPRCWPSCGSERNFFFFFACLVIHVHTLEPPYSSVRTVRQPFTTASEPNMTITKRTKINAIMRNVLIVSMMIGRAGKESVHVVRGMKSWHTVSLVKVLWVLVRKSRNKASAFLSKER
ncbi:hypothetical protein B0J12DRAFT_78615 [Macrophomina phaseolina]|uniref:Secreted protein n=1 Tax=Macrophomina phaseolina TaxID=35725 RepID=A0ABQ8GBN7_9PEZI|nr:hypothetical protein B0J12DRAFT_78615 [Macrophomina phaseolina]